MIRPEMIECGALDSLREMNVIGRNKIPDLCAACTRNKKLKDCGAMKAAEALLKASRRLDWKQDDKTIVY